MLYAIAGWVGQCGFDLILLYNEYIAGKQNVIYLQIDLSTAVFSCFAKVELVTE